MLLGGVTGDDKAIQASYRVFINGGWIRAIATLEDQLFITRRKCTHVAVYSTATFELQRRITIIGASRLLNLATCSTNNCLYVSDYENHAIHKVNLSASGEK